MSALKCEKQYKYTDKEVRFCDAIVFKGRTQYDAYLYAGYSTYNGDRRKAEAKASTVANKGKMKERIEELSGNLQEKKLDKAIWSFEDSVRDLKKLKDNAGKMSDAINAIKELNNMYGFNKQNINMDANVKTQTPEEILKGMQGDEY